MRIELKWLGEMLHQDLDPGGLAEQLTIGGLEVDSVQSVAGNANGDDDVVLELDLTPNRGDCFSILGVAREVAALTGTRMEPPDVVPVPASVDNVFPVTLGARDACPRFAGRVIRNIDPGCRSPSWLEERLERAGLRALHPVVDVTNYVMLELGQPLHGYDLQKLEQRITVRFATAGERLTLLDGTQLTLDPRVLVIADDSGAIGLAGIMGGQGTAVSDSTCDVFLESAYFAPSAIRGRARQFALHTDASLRFERGVDPCEQQRAIERATALLLDIAGGDPGPITEAIAADRLPARNPINLRLDRLNAVLGTSLESDEVAANLRLLHMDLTPCQYGWFVVPPPFRFDVSIEEDLVEEVGRMVGYGKIPAVAERSPRHLGTATESRLDEQRIADALCAREYAEIVTYGFVDEELAGALNPDAKPVRVTNPLSREMGVMRRSLWPGLLVTARENLSRQQSRARLFEIGTQFAPGGDCVRERRVVAGVATGPYRAEHWEGGSREVDIFDVKADVEAIIALTGRSGEAQFEAASHPALADGQSARLRLADEAVGWLGVLHPRVQKYLGLKMPAILFAIQLDPFARAEIPRFQQYSKFPSLRRDIAVVLDEEIPADEIVGCVRKAAGDLLQGATVFDIYRGKGIDSGLKSVALGLILQDRSRTLTVADADRVVATATQRLEQELGATIRG